MHEEEQDTADSDDPHRPLSVRLKVEPAVADSFDIKLSHALRNLDDEDEENIRTVAPDVPSPDRRAGAKAAWKKVLKMPDSSSKGSSVSKPAARRRLGVRVPFFKHKHHVNSNNAVEIGTRSPCE
tara:strand:- start:343 stop:717 length:375 start_codon:yes stop_codon:yes gene_type:complete